MGCMGSCGVVHTAHRQWTTQIPIEFYVLVIGFGLGLGLIHCQCEETIKVMFCYLGENIFACFYF